MKLSSSFLALALALSPTVSAGPLDDFLNSIKPTVSSPTLQLLMQEWSLLRGANKLVDFAAKNGGHRAFGSGGHNATVQYIKDRLDRTGYYDVELQTFPYLYSEGSATFTANGNALDTNWLTYGPAGDVEKPMYVVANVGCELSDFPAEVAGNIALIRRGTCEFGHKTALAGAAGAAGAIIYNNVEGELTATLGQTSRPDVGPYVPVSTITLADAEAIIADINAGREVIGNLQVDAVTEDRWSSNVIATTKYGDKNNIVFAGAHTDSVAAGAGISDNGSGTISILDIATSLPLFKVNNAVRFGWWTAEEFGLVGSDYYVSHLSEEERQKIAMYLNFDMIASPNYVYGIYNGDGTAFPEIGAGPAGSEHIEATFKDWFASKNLKSLPTEFSGRSDYGPFMDVGIPSGGLFTGADEIKTEEQVGWFGGEAGAPLDPCYHQLCDDINNIHVGAWVQNTRAAAHSIATYAKSVDGIPREPRAVVSASRTLSAQRKQSACGKSFVLA